MLRRIITKPAHCELLSEITQAHYVLLWDCTVENQEGTVIGTQLFRQSVGKERKFTQEGTGEHIEVKDNPDLYIFSIYLLQL